MPDDPDRRRFLKMATCAIGGGVGLAAGVPVLGLVLDPARRDTVTTPTDPIDVGDAGRLAVGGEPRRFDVIAPVVKDAWTAARDVVLGAAWIRRTAPDQYEAFSSVCPHLGCAVGWDAAAKNFLCPCHDSRFAAGGDRITGPSERGLDALELKVDGGRLRLVWQRFRMGSTTKEPA